MTSRAVESSAGGPRAPKPEVLASLTDHHFLAALSAADEPLSRAEVAARTGLSKPAMATAALRLRERGLISEVGQRQGRRGGVATLLEVNAGRGHSIAIAVQPDACSARIRDLVGRVLFDGSERLAADAGPDDVVETTNALIDRARRTVGSPLLAAAVSIADPVDFSTGEPVALAESAFPAGRISPRRDLDLQTPGPVVVDNDVNWASLAARRSGVMHDCDDFVYVYCGAGLGAGLVLGGRLYRGRRGLAGEIGYLRDEAGADLTQRLAELGLGRLDGYGLDMDAAQRLLDGRELSPQTQAVVDTLSRHLANVAILVNPEAVVLAGPLSDHPAFVAGLRAGIIRLTPDPPEVVVGSFAPLMGASDEAHENALAEVGLPTAGRL